jgi:hypothetical protein
LLFLLLSLLLVVRSSAFSGPCDLPVLLQIDLPEYTSAAVVQEKLAYACAHAKTFAIL